MKRKRMMSRWAATAATLLPAIIGSVPAVAAGSAGDPAAVAAPAAAPRADTRPNVLLWLLDDVGFAQLASYGGIVDTPNIDRVVANGLRYDNYHTAPVCSASRAAILTGRMPHSVNMGGHAALPMTQPGYSGRVPAAAGTIAENLRQAGYATFALGKWDHLPPADMASGGPTTYWPTGQGFERYYGFMAADTDQWHPNLIRDNTPIPTPSTPGYLLNVDLADQAIRMIDSRDSGPPRPFFMYYATGTAHAPHHAPPEWIARYRGKFDMGWDKLREQVLQREIARGIVPKGTRLAPRPEGMPAWDSLSADQKRMYTRQMETFAAALSFADAQFGRVLDQLEKRGELANTMVIVTSDNGASAEGGPEGMLAESFLSAQKQPALADNLKFYDQWGGPATYPTYAFGWAVAGDTPYRYYKQTTYEGGQRVPLIVSWPKGFTAHGELRRQYTHVADIAPTILEAAGVTPAAVVNQVPQSPMEGASFAASFTAPGDPRQARGQYSEMFGNRAFSYQGWAIVANHRTATWRMTGPPTFDEPWELYDVVADPGQTTNLAAKYPDKVAELDRMFADQAARYHVLPQHNQTDGLAETARLSAASFAARHGQWRFTGPVGMIPPVSAPPVLARGFTMSARLDLPEGGVTGPLFAQGSSLGGMGLYLDRGRPVFMAVSLLGEAHRVEAAEALPAGAADLTLEVARGTPGADGATDLAVTIRAGDKVMAQQTVHLEVPRNLDLAETFAVGQDDASPLLPGYPAGQPFPGTIREMVFDFTR